MFPKLWLELIGLDILIPPFGYLFRFSSVVFNLAQRVVVEAKYLVARLSVHDDLALLRSRLQRLRHAHFLIVFSHWLHGCGIGMLLGALGREGDLLVASNAQSRLRILHDRQLNHISS